MNTFNHDVKFRLAEIALIYGLDCLIRYHLANMTATAGKVNVCKPMYGILFVMEIV